MIDVFVSRENLPVETERTVASIKFALGATFEPTVVDSFDASFIAKLNTSKNSLVHLVKAGIIVFPLFYQAAQTILEQTKRDYSFCHCLKVEKTAELLTTPKEFGQVILKRWVVKEINEPDVNKLFEIALRDYRGQEINAILCLR